MSRIVTIIIPTYNMEKYLQKCLNSLLVSDDNLRQIEVLVVNDGSNDSSSLIAHEFEMKYPRTFRVIDKENGNYGSCVNRGLKEAKGKYVKILDADDYFDTVAFETAITFLKSCDYDLVLTDYNKVDEEGNLESMFKLTIPHNTPLTFDSLLGFSASRMHMHRIFYKTVNLRAIGYHQTEGMSYTDQEWMGEPMTTVNSLYYLNIYLYQYLVGRGEQTMNPQVMMRSINQYMHAIYVLIDLYNRYVGDSAHHKYIWFRINGQMRLIYNLFLCENKNVELISLKVFDETIKSKNVELYEDADSFTIGGFRFVAYWRRRDYQNSGVLLPTFYALINSSKRTIKSLLPMNFYRKLKDRKIKV